jgi:hypothetical protein
MLSEKSWGGGGGGKKRGTLKKAILVIIILFFLVSNTRTQWVLNPQPHPPTNSLINNKMLV